MIKFLEKWCVYLEGDARRTVERINIFYRPCNTTVSNTELDYHIPVN
uniref:Uncharacterized protein n=1 Tax=Arundo donax TaxID=35708 RepID=A0A0A9GAC0_ARUDO